MIALLQIKVVGNVESLQLVDKLPGIVVVGLIFGGGTQENVQLLGGFCCGDHQQRAIGAAIFDAGSPDSALRSEVRSKSQHIAKDVGVVDSDIHGTEGTHRVARDRAVRSVGNGAIVAIDVAHQVERDRIFEHLATVAAIGPLAGRAMATVAIWRNDDQFRYGLRGDQRIGVLVRFARQKPVADFAGRAVQGVEDGVTSARAHGRVVGCGQIDIEGTALVMQGGTDVATGEDSARGSEKGSAMDIDIGRKDEEIDRTAGEEDQG